jgi:AraC-like DNA-binding protein
MRVPYTDVRVEYMDTPERRVLDLRADGLAEVPLLGWQHYNHARPDLPLHRHLGTIEICLMGRGHQLFRIEDQDYHLGGGEVLVTLPDEMHSSAGQPMEPQVLYWLNVRLPKGDRSMLGLSRKESAELFEALTALPRRHFPASPPLKTLFDRLLELHGHSEIDMQPLRMRQAMVQLLLEVVDSSKHHAERQGPLMMSEVIRYVRSHLDEEFRLEDLARKAGYSLSRFKARFKAETGISPRQFVLWTKIEAAGQRLLAGGDSIGKIAGDLGFPTSQYFATVFRRFMGVSPRTYRDESARPHGPSHCREDQQG